MQSLLAGRTQRPLSDNQWVSRTPKQPLKQNELSLNKNLAIKVLPDKLLGYEITKVVFRKHDESIIPKEDALGIRFCQKYGFPQR